MAALVTALDGYLQQINHFKLMKKIHLVEEWDFMDSKPSQAFVSIEETEIHNWVKSLNDTYSGSTTKYIRALSKSEAHNWALDEIYKVINKPCVTRTNGDLDSADVDRIKNIYKMLNETYQ